MRTVNRSTKAAALPFLTAMSLLLGGCVGNTPGPEAPPTTIPTPARLSPQVTNPLDAGDFEDDPCASLTESQRRNLGLHSGTALDQSDGISCEFRDPDDANLLLAYVFYSSRSSGLDFLYGMNEGGAWSYWKTTEIDGYPAVAYTVPETPEHCNIAVGIADSLYISASAGDDGCPAAEKVAAAVLSTIKADQ